MQTFLAMLNPMLVLFICMAIGFVLKATGILSNDAGKTIAKLETWIFCPALSFITMSKYCTVKSFSTHSVNLIFACLVLALTLAIAIPLARAFTRKNKDERGIYEYAFAVANFGYMGDALILFLLGGEFLSFYKIFTLPGTIIIYIWGVGRLVPNDSGSKLKRIVNAPMVAVILGMIVGLSGLGNHLPVFVENTFNTLSACMGPMAMILAGFTVARFDFVKMIKEKRVYLATLFRLVIIPIVIISALYGIKELSNAIFNTSLDNSILYLTFFYVATPFGLNTIVFPEAYGGEAKTGASMALISSIFCIVTIPLLYALIEIVFK